MIARGIIAEKKMKTEVLRRTMTIKKA